MDENDFFNRNQPYWSNILVRPNDKYTMITVGSGIEKCIELVKIILSESSEGVRDLIKRTKEDVNNDINWTEAMISNWRKEFHVILPKVVSISEQIKESSESNESFAGVREALDLLEEDEEGEEEDNEIEDNENIYKETVD